MASVRIELVFDKVGTSVCEFRRAVRWNECLLAILKQERWYSDLTSIANLVIARDVEVDAKPDD